MSGLNDSLTDIMILEKAKDDRALEYIINNYDSATKAMYDESQYNDARGSYCFVSKIIKNINYDIKDVVNSLISEDLGYTLQNIESKLSIGSFDITIR